MSKPMIRTDTNHAQGQTIAQTLDDAYQKVSDALGMIYRLNGNGEHVNGTDRLREAMETIKDVANEYDAEEVRI